MRRALALLLTLAACATAGPVPLQWGVASCSHCHMTLADRRYGAEIVTVRGRAYPYDDAGCAAEAIATGEVAAAEVGGVWVVDYTDADRLLPADSATFVRSATFRTPMGSGLAAAPDPRAAAALAARVQGTVLRWADVLELARSEGLRPH